MGGHSIIGWIRGKGLEVTGCLLHRFCLLGTHGKCLCTREQSRLVVLYCLNSAFYNGGIALIPLSCNLIDTTIAQYLMYCMVIKNRAIIAHSRAYQFHFPRLRRCDSRIMLFHAHINISCSVTHFETSFITRVRVSVNNRSGLHPRL